MHGTLKICNAVYWLALTVWIASLVSAGLAAMNVFGTLPKMAIQLDHYSAAPQESHGRLAAGMVMEGVFHSVDVLQFIAAPIALVALLMQIVFFRMRTLSNWVRGICVILAACLFAFHAIALAPTMNHELHQYRHAAETGDAAAAQSHLESFNAKHPTAQTIMQVNLVLLLIAVAASAVALGPHRARQADLHIPNLMRMR